MIQPFIGRLGNGGEDDSDTPQQVPLPAKQQIESVVAGPDCTFLIASSGKVLACGNNEHNKLGLNSEVRGVAKRRAKVTNIYQHCQKIWIYCLCRCIFVLIKNLIV